MPKYSSKIDKRPGKVKAEFNGFNVMKVGKKVYSLQVGRWIRVREVH